MVSAQLAARLAPRRQPTTPNRSMRHTSWNGISCRTRCLVAPVYLCSWNVISHLRRERNPVKIMTIFAHPADTITNCGGTLARHADRGDEIVALILTHGGRRS